MLIDGQWCAARNGRELEVANPANEAVIAMIPAGEAPDIERAVSAARAAFESRRWTSLPPGTRAQILWRVADLLESRSVEFAELESLDTGKPIALSRTTDIPGAASIFRYWAGWCTKISGETRTLDLPGEFLTLTVREPVGVAGLITPWNYPILGAAVKLAPALAAGCTVILKPAEQTSLTSLRLGELLLEAGVPAGVANIVTGTGPAAGAALAENGDVDKIAFTGSTAVGKILLAAAQGNLKRLTLELGGKSPTVILADADLQRAIPGAANAIFRNAGQMCVAGSRLYVAGEVFDTVLEGIVAHAERYRLGPGLHPDTTMGSLISGAQQRRVLAHIASAREDGASILTGGTSDGDRGHFVKPTVITGTRPDMRVVREEIFGPVLIAERVDDPEQLAKLANDSVYGLSANIWTRDISSAYRLANRIRAGTVTINCGTLVGPNLPFGGFKQSGWGREGGLSTIDAFTEIKTMITAV